MTEKKKKGDDIDRWYVWYGKREVVNKEDK